ncbi:hypothetical protein QFC21_004658 [Naganishia friedmannii]|uniref:Uncharacterized protein n=1 Tax=Naganishia friedmannii TaxID=89922 RepID=A0ACC2VGC8_9TREE|nr:hypothetical protein QFC21_004658 [Naganishia friedmannii]
MSVSRDPSNFPPARPRTAASFLSRPPSTRPGTAFGARSNAHSDNLGEWVVAVNQGREQGMTVGIAAYDTVSGRVIITEIRQLRLDELVKKVGAGATLRTKVQVYWYNVWKASYDHIKNYIVQDDERRAGVLVTTQDKYYGTAAMGALFRYLFENGEAFAPHSLRIEYKALDGTMLIDLDTANNLELVKSSLDGKPKNSLYGVMNRTHTQMAARLLRSTILQPVIVKDILENRLSVVEGKTSY